MKRCTIMFTVVVVAIGLCGCGESDEAAFKRFSGYDLPADASGFTWDTANHDEFGDHDGQIRFTASRKSLELITSKPFRGSSPWVATSASGAAFSFSHEEAGAKITGSINLQRETFAIDYMTW